MNYPELKDAVIREDAVHHADETLVEDKATGTPIIQELGKNTKINFVPILPDSDKVARLTSVSPTFRAKNVYIRSDAPWSKLLVEQLTMFPNCKIKDIADSVSQYLNYKRESKTMKSSQLRGGRKTKVTSGY